MLLWRLSTRQHAASFDGGYGLLFGGRWNTVGHPVTYCATSPSLCVLEKLVHIEDPELLPELVMITYDSPDSIGIDTIGLAELPDDWRRRESWTQQKGDDWHHSRSSPLLMVPSAIIPLPDSPDVNVMVSHTHPACAAITVRSMVPLILDPRLL